jgi:hypothetical protein
MPQNLVAVTRAWSKTLGHLAPGSANPSSFSKDPFYQFFTQINAIIADNQNTIFQSGALTSGATTMPATGANFRVMAGGVYQLIATGQNFPNLPALPLITTGNFGIWYFTVDNAGVLRTYAGANNNAATRAALLVPSPLPGPNEAVIGFLEVAPSGATFTPGTTNINAANINATVISIVGEANMTAYGMTELQIS